jgi:hypothetical protein
MLLAQLLALSMVAAMGGAAMAAQHLTTMSAGSPSVSSYVSALETYESYKEQPVGSWLEANDTVRRIGGWRAYANEAQGKPAAQPSVPTPARTDGPAKATGPSGAPGNADPHGGHHR